jgi:hypothetical protein
VLARARAGVVGGDEALWGEGGVEGRVRVEIRCIHGSASSSKLAPAIITSQIRKMIFIRTESRDSSHHFDATGKLEPLSCFHDRGSLSARTCSPTRLSWCLDFHSTASMDGSSTIMSPSSSRVSLVSRPFPLSWTFFPYPV